MIPSCPEYSYEPTCPFLIGDPLRDNINKSIHMCMFMGHCIYLIYTIVFNKYMEYKAWLISVVQYTEINTHMYVCGINTHG